MADEGEDISFASPEEEIEYWKEKAMEYRAKYDRLVLARYVYGPFSRLVLFVA